MERLKMQLSSGQTYQGVFCLHTDVGFICTVELGTIEICILNHSFKGIWVEAAFLHQTSVSFSLALLCMWCYLKREIKPWRCQQALAEYLTLSHLFTSVSAPSGIQFESNKRLSFRI